MSFEASAAAVKVGAVRQIGRDGEDAGPSMAAKVVLMLLAGYADADGKCFPGQQHLADFGGMSLRAVNDALALLERRGFISRSRRNREDGSRTSDWITVEVTALEAAGLHAAAARRAAAASASLGNHSEIPAAEDPTCSECGGSLHATAAGPMCNCCRAYVQPLQGLHAAAAGHESSEDKSAFSLSPAGDDLKVRPDLVRALAGDVLGSEVKHAGLASMVELDQLLVGDQPCSKDLDLYPAISQAAAWYRGQGRLMTSWTLVRRIALENRDSRLSGLPSPKELSDHDHGTGNRDRPRDAGQSRPNPQLSAFARAADRRDGR